MASIQGRSARTSVYPSMALGDPQAYVSLVKDAMPTCRSTNGGGVNAFAGCDGKRVFKWELNSDTIVGMRASKQCNHLWRRTILVSSSAQCLFTACGTNCAKQQHLPGGCQRRCRPSMLQPTEGRPGHRRRSHWGSGSLQRRKERVGVGRRLLQGAHKRQTSTCTLVGLGLQHIICF